MRACVCCTDRFPMTDNVRLMFEVDDLRNASPATVSRVGIVFVADTDLDWLPLVNCFVASFTKDVADHIRALFVEFVAGDEAEFLGLGVTFSTGRGSGLRPKLSDGKGAGGLYPPVQCPCIRALTTFRCAVPLCRGAVSVALRDVHAVCEPVSSVRCAGHARDHALSIGQSWNHVAGDASEERRTRRVGAYRALRAALCVVVVAAVAAGLNSPCTVVCPRPLRR